MSNVEGKNVFGGRIVKDRVGALSGGFDLRDRRQFVEIEDRHRAGASVADETAMQIGRDRDPMNAVGFWDRADNLLMIDVDDIDAIAV